VSICSQSTNSLLERITYLQKITNLFTIIFYFNTKEKAMQGTILELFITKNDENKTREQVQSIKVDKDGILEDKFHGKNLLRSILISSTDSYEITKSNGIEIEKGSLGENILVDLNPYALVCGDKLQIGDTILEITQNCTLCKGLAVVNPKLPKLLKDDRGIFAKVISGHGIIRINDKVTILK